MVDSQVQSNGWSAWVAAVAASCVVTLAYGAYITSTHAGREVASSVGYGLPVVLIIWGVLQLGLKDNLYNKSKKTLSLVAIVAGFIIGIIGGHQYSKYHFINGITETQHIFHNSLVRGEPSHGSIEKSFTITDNIGDVEKMQVFIHNFVVKLSGVRTDYLKQIQATGYARILEPERVKVDKSLDQSFKILSKVKSINKKYEYQTKNIFKNIKSEILALDVSESSKASMLNGFHNSISKSKAELAYGWSLEHEKIDTYNRIFMFLRQHRSAWSIQTGHFAFTNQHDLNKFNNYIGQLNSIVRRQQSIRQQRIKKLDKVFDNLKHTVQ